MITIIHILGSGHCGSTILDLLLGTHPDITGLGEIHRFSIEPKIQREQRCTCNQPVSSCPFWTRVSPDTLPNQGDLRIHQLRQRKHTIERKGELPPIDTAAYRGWTKSLYHCIAKCSQNSILVDSSKDSRRLAMLTEFPTDTFNHVGIHLIRDGRAVLWSYKLKYGKILPAILRWIASNIRIELLKWKMPILSIRYEDLVTDPQKTIDTIAKKVHFSPKPLVFPLQTKGQHQIAGNRLRFQKEIHLKQDKSWRENLHFTDRLLFCLLGGWLNLYYGYPPF